MRFVHRTVVQLAGISGLAEDPWQPVVSVPLATFNAKWVAWLTKLRLVDLTVTATVTKDELRFAELDASRELANRILTRRFLGDDVPIESVEDIRRKRAERLGVTEAWLIVDVHGDDSRTRDDDFPELVPDLNLSFEEVAGASKVGLSLGAYDMQVVRDQITGAICLAASHRIRTRPVGRCWWYMRPDGRPHHLVGSSMSARAIASTSLATNPTHEVTVTLSRVESSTTMSTSLAAFGQSLAYDLDPTLEFLAAFTALENVVKARTPARLRAGDPSVGLRKWFMDLVGENDPDRQIFDNLYAERNGVAHRARFTNPPAEDARRLFERLLAEAAEPPT